MHLYNYFSGYVLITPAKHHVQHLHHQAHITVLLQHSAFLVQSQRRMLKSAAAIRRQVYTVQHTQNLFPTVIIQQRVLLQRVSQVHGHLQVFLQMQFPVQVSQQFTLYGLPQQEQNLQTTITQQHSPLLLMLQRKLLL